VPPAGSYLLGPDTGALRLRTSRAGVAARAGHDLLLEIGQWSGRLTLTGDDPATAELDVEIDLGSLRVLEGTGGVKPLSDGDRREIRKTALRVLDVERHPTARYVSTGIRPTTGGGTIDGTLTVRGEEAAVPIEVSETTPGSWRGTATVLQTAHGITPYRAFLGALRLADAVGVEVSVTLPAGGPR
jgi:polyisoprenoid-binding protein YceI